MNWFETVSSVFCGIKKFPDDFDSDFHQPITVQDLPDDILTEIFSYLSGDYFKATSLVCRRWNELTFKTANIQLNVTVFNRDRSMEKSYRRLLLASKRPYRHLKIVDCQRAFISSLSKKFSPYLESLTLSCTIDVVHLPKIFKFSANLRKLNILFSNFDRTSKKLIILPTLHNLQTLKADISFLYLAEVNLKQLCPNLTSLTIHFSEDLPVPESVLDYFTPRLQELELQVSFPHKPGSKIHKIWDAKFPLLKRFGCYLDRVDKSPDRYDPEPNVERFLNQSWSIESVKLYRVVYNRWLYLSYWNRSEDEPERTQDLFIQLGETCSTLREVSLGMLELREEQFLQLCNLQNLRKLHIEESIIHSPTSDSCQIVDSLTELSLQTTEVDDADKFNDFVRINFPNLTKLSTKNCKSLTSLTELKFSGLDSLEQLTVRQILPLSWVYLANLKTFPVLRNVSIFCESFAEYNLEHHPGVVSGSIRTMEVTAALTDEDLHRLVTFFPCLITLKLGRPERCTSEGIQKARELVPSCCFVLPVRY